MASAKKRAQMEILGLAIVVVIILVATVFIIKFSVLKKPTGYRQGFVSSELASNMLSTYLNTNAPECSQLTMTELLQDCAQGDSICCLDCDDDLPQNDIKSCGFINATASAIFAKTLDEWRYGYEFLAYIDINNPLVKLGGTCAGQKRSKIFPIPLDAGTMYTRLDICG